MGVRGDDFIGRERRRHRASAQRQPVASRLGFFSECYREHRHRLATAAGRGHHHPHARPLQHALRRVRRGALLAVCRCQQQAAFRERIMQRCDAMRARAASPRASLFRGTACFEATSQLPLAHDHVRCAVRHHVPLLTIACRDCHLMTFQEQQRRRMVHERLASGQGTYGGRLCRRCAQRQCPRMWMRACDATYARERGGRRVSCLRPEREREGGVTALRDWDFGRWRCLLCKWACACHSGAPLAC